MAWGSMPLVCALPVWAIGFSAFGVTLVREGAFGIPGVLVILAVQLAFGVWTLALQVACTAEVHRFSVMRALLTGVLAWIVFVGTVVALVLAAMALGK
jgi:ABC-type multidrug transport system permease subunit